MVGRYGNLGMREWSISQQVLQEWANLSIVDSLRDQSFHAGIGLCHSSSDTDVGFCFFDVASS